MKFKFLNRIIASALLISSLTQVSGAAQQCAVHFSGASAETTGERDLQSQIKKLQKVSFTALEKTQLAELIAQTGVTRFADHADLIKKLTAKIESEDLPPMEKSDKLAQVGLQIQDILEKRIETFFQKNGLTFAVESKFKLTSAEITAALKLANPAISEVELKLKSEKIEKEYAAIRLDLVKSRYGLSEKIAQLEAFKISEYEFVDSHALNNSGYTLISLTDYPDFAMSLAKKISPPRNYGSGGVVSLPEYRDVVSNNLWLFTLSGHDLKHIHFANSHPFAMGSIFRATRSKNYLRYFLMAASYEGVDTVQYGFETALARHFSAKGHTLEEALLFLTSDSRTIK